MKKYLLIIVMLVGFTGMAMAQQHRPPMKHHRHHVRHHRHVVHHRHAVHHMHAAHHRPHH